MTTKLFMLVLDEEGLIALIYDGEEFDIKKDPQTGKEMIFSHFTL
jgi:hypothetical protein